MALEDLYPEILARAIVTFRKNCVMSQVVNRDVTADLMKFGDVANIPVPQPRTATDVVPAAVPPGGETPQPKNVQVGLDFWKDSAFTLNDREFTNMANSSTYIPAELQMSSIAIAESVDSSIFDVYKGVYGTAGTAGVTPFGTSTVEAQDAVRVLATQKCPKTPDRHMVLNEFAYANAIGLDVLQRVDASGSNITLREAIIGRALGFWWHEDVNVPTGTAPAGSGYLVNQVGHAVGDTTVTLDTGTGTIVEGDIFTVGAGTQNYVVTSVAGAVVTYEPPAPVAFANNAAVTFLDHEIAGLAFDGSAIAFVSRPASAMAVQQLLGANVARVSTWVDVDDMGNGSGIVMSLEVKREHYQTSFYLSAMWGRKLIAANMCCRILG